MRKSRSWLDDPTGWGAGLLAVILVLGWVAFWGAVIYVAVHFIAKFW